LVGRHLALLTALPLFAMPCLEAPARAEIGASVSVQSDARFRGRSLSAGRPTGSLSLSYDGPEGVYLGSTALGVATRHEGVKFLGVQGNIGIARRLPSGLVLDAGVDHSRYGRYYSPGFSARYTELYAGVVGRNLSSHIYYSPDYFGLGFATLYGEVDGVIRPADRLRVNAHLGALVRTDGERAAGYDWRIGVAAELRHFDLQLSVSGGGPGRQFYGRRSHNREAVTAGVTHFF
jgi:uncharacterized protein (TIGR02001 family)